MMKFAKRNCQQDSLSNHKQFSNALSGRFRNVKYHSPNGINGAPVTSHKSAKVTEVFDNKLKIFIKNIPDDGDSVKSRIQQLLSPCGEILHEWYFTRRRGTHLIHTALIVLKSEAAVEEALGIHGSEVEGRHIIVSKNAQYNSNQNGVRVKNLAWDVTEEDLWNVFESIGKILFINITNPVNLNAADQPLEGEIIFETEEQAEEALSMDNTEIHGLPLDVTRNSLRNKDDHADFAVHVSGLPQDVSKEKVIQFFEKCGVVRMVKVNFKHLSAVIHFTSDEAVSAAMQLDGRSLDGSRISVHQRKGEVFNVELENPVYLNNIPESVKDVDLFLAFQDCGQIVDVRFLPRKTNSMKRAVIQFKYPDSIAKAIELDGSVLSDEQISVSNSEDNLSSENTPQSLINGNGTCRSKSKNKKRNQSSKKNENVSKKAKTGGRKPTN